MAKANAATKLQGYETTIITRPELSDEQVKSIQDRIAAVASEYKGEMVLVEDWGRRKLAYNIQKESRGQYTYLVYTGKGNVVQEVERHLRLQEHVLRFLTVNLATEFDPEAFKHQRAEAQAAVKRREQEMEARREARRNRFSEDGGGYEGRGSYEPRGGYERDRDESRDEE